MTSMVAWKASSPPASKALFQPRTVGSWSSLGLPAMISFIAPMPSEWSATTSQSSGRESLNGSPCEVITSSPRAKR